MFYLFITIVLDVLGVSLLGKAKGWGNHWCFIGGLVSMMVGFAAFSYATRTVPVGIANALWSGLSIALVLAVGLVFFDEQLTFMHYVFVAMILIGAVGLQVMERA